MLVECQKTHNISVLVQVGNLGSSIIDHLLRPVSLAGNVNKVQVFCHHSGPSIPNVEYHCPPKFMAKSAITAIIYESIDLFFHTLFNQSVTLAGFLLNPHGIIAFVVAKLNRKKVIIYLIAGRHELYTNDRNKGSIKDVDFNITLPPWYGKLFLIILKHTNAIITTGSVTKSFLVKCGIKVNNIHPIISPVNNQRFYHITFPKIYDVLSVGSLILIKHHEILLQTIFEVKSLYPHIRVCIVGDGPRKNELIQLAEKLGISENIDFVGFQTDVPYYYNSSKIFIHTSETEGLPNVVLEAMMCGLPCIVSNCGDILDIAKDGYNSLVIQKFDDYRGFANAIYNLLENDELYNNICRNALKITESVSIENVTQQWELILANNNFAKC